MGYCNSCCNTNHSVANELSTFVNPQLATIVSTQIGRELLPLSGNCACSFFPTKQYYDYDFSKNLEWGLIQKSYCCCISGAQPRNQFSNQLEYNLINKNYDCCILGAKNGYKY